MNKQKMLPELILSLSNGYNGKKLVKDIIAGIIVGIIALPLSIALAIASGATPAEGLITAVFAGATAAALGGCKTQISGPTGAFIVIVYGILAENGMGGLILATFMAGFIIVIMGILKLGKLIKYIPLPIITGFTAGIAVTIFIGQLNDFLGLQLKGLPSESIEKFVAVVSNLGKFSLISFGMGIFSIIIIVLVPKLQKILPGPLCAIIICTVINIFLPVKCVTLGDIYGTITINIHPSFMFFDFSKFGNLIIPAFTIAFLAAIESLLSAVVADGMTGTKHNPNMELVGQGCANMVSAVFGGLPATGAIARTSANIRSGGASPVSSLTHAVVILLLSLFLMPYAKFIPMTVFASILIVVCYNMLNVKEIKKIIKTNPVDIGLMVLTFALTVIFDLVVAILICTFLSLGYQLFMAYFKKRVAFRENEGSGIRVRGHLTYMNYEKVLAGTAEGEMLIDMTEVETVDATTIDYLETKAKNKKIKINCTNKKLIKQLEKHSEIAEVINK